MLDEDLEPKNKPVKPKDLEPLSVEELEEYTEQLHKEIERVAKEIKKKKAHRDAASSVFKS